MEIEERKPSATAIVNYNGLIMNRINIALNFIDHGFSGYNQVMGLRAILKPQFKAELSETFKEEDTLLKKVEDLDKRIEIKGTQGSVRVKMMQVKNEIIKQYTWNVLNAIISCLDKHGYLEYTERDLIDSGVVH